MPIYRMRSLGSKGVVKDLPPFDLPPDVWSDASNVRFFGGRVTKFGGNVPALKETKPEGITPLSIVQRSNKEELIYGTFDSIYRVYGGIHENIGALIDPDNVDAGHVQYEASPDTTWYYTTLSNSMIMCNELTDPQGLRPTDDYFSTIPGWGRPFKPESYDEQGKPVYNYTKKNWKTPRMRSYKNYLIAMGMIEGGTEYPQRVRWSDISYVNDLPTNWHEDDPNTDGGFNDLTDSIGMIVDGCPLRDSFIIYTDRDTFIMDYVGGDYIFNWRKLFSDSGILAPECVVEFEGQHFVVSESDIFVHNGSNRKSVVTGRLKDYLIDEIASVNPFATKVFAFEPKKEIWVCYAGPGSSLSPVVGGTAKQRSWSCNKAAVWNWEYDTWTFYDIPHCYDINLGLPQTLDTRHWDQYCGTEATTEHDSIIPEGCTDVWDGDSHKEELWEEFGKTFKKQLIYVPSAYGGFYILDEGDTFHYHNENGELMKRPMVSSLERRSLDFDDQEGEINRHKFIKAIYPQFTGKGSVRFYTGGSNDPESPPEWDGSTLFIIGEDTKVDCFTNYRYIAIKLLDTNEGDWSFTGMDIQYFMEGTR